MQTENRADWLHDHAFDTGNAAAERGTRIVLWITLGMMVVEIGAGWWLNSMALLADGWHMSSHALAIGLSVLSYAAARRYADDPSFSLGTWKIEVLGGFASAVLLLAVAGLMLFGSVERIVSPEPIRYREAIGVAVLGLLVNIVCAAILGKAHQHGPHGTAGHGHSHDQHDHPHDLNLRSAYVHVLADAATSVLAVIALAGGWLYGWSWLDPAMGIVGALLVAVWSKGLIIQTARVLLDREMDHPVVGDIRAAVQEGGPGQEIQVTDLHIWRVGKSAYSCAMTVVSIDPALTPTRIRQRLARLPTVVHSTIEVHYRRPPSA